MGLPKSFELLPGRTGYEIRDLTEVLTPALAVYPETVASNIRQTLKLLGGDANRWRPHVKTAKLESVINLLVSSGIKSFKCATSLELLTVCSLGVEDVLLAHFPMGANAHRVLQIAREYPEVRISVLIDSLEDLDAWTNSNVGIFVDINPGLDRTGIAESKCGRISWLIEKVKRCAVEFRGLHYYDGHLVETNELSRYLAARRGYERLRKVIDRLDSNGIVVPEVVTSGTPTFVTAMDCTALQSGSRFHRVSAGTVVYCDLISLEQLQGPSCYRPAAVVLSRVVSHPTSGVVTCDAGHKSLPTDSGKSNCLVLGEPGLLPTRSSEEHLSFHVVPGTRVPRKGEILYLVPRHVCPAINSFDHALLVRNGRIESVQPVSARGREAPTVTRVSTPCAEGA